MAQLNSSNRVEVLVWTATPEDFPSWPHDRKVDRYERVIAWHKRSQRLWQDNKILAAWGAHQLLGRVTYSTSYGPLLAVYSVGSWQEFDQLLDEDPLRDVSRINTTPLTPLSDDRATDQARYDDHKARFFRGKSSLDVAEFERLRARYDGPPDFVGKYPYTAPPNPRTDWNRRWRAGDPLEVLLLGHNPDEYISMWDDVRKLIHHEKVMWWHDYTAMLIAQEKIIHAWGTHDFCWIEAPQPVSAAAAAVYRVRDYDEFDTLYRLDPIRTSTLFWSVLLQPIADQQAADERRLQLAVARRGK